MSDMREGPANHKLQQVFQNSSIWRTGSFLRVCRMFLYGAECGLFRTGLILLSYGEWDQKPKYTKFDRWIPNEYHHFPWLQGHSLCQVPSRIKSLSVQEEDSRAIFQFFTWRACQLKKWRRGSCCAIYRIGAVRRNSKPESYRFICPYWDELWPVNSRKIDRHEGRSDHSGIQCKLFC